MAVGVCVGAAAVCRIPLSGLECTAGPWNALHGCDSLFCVGISIQPVCRITRLLKRHRAAGLLNRQKAGVRWNLPYFKWVWCSYECKWIQAHGEMSVTERPRSLCCLSGSTTLFPIWGPWCCRWEELFQPCHVRRPSWPSLTIRSKHLTLLTKKH